MASELDDLNFEIKGNISSTMDALKDLGAKLDDVFKQVDKIDQSFRTLGQSLGLPAAQIELLLLRVQPLINTLAKADKQAASLEESFTRKLMAKALEEHNKKVITLADGTQRARYEMIRLAEASTQLRIPTQAPRAPADTGGGTGSGGVNFVRVTAAAAQMTMMARVATTMRTVSESVQQVGRTSNITADAMTRFRMGLQAVPVNPALNVVKNGLDAVGGSAFKVIDTLRGVADAILSDLPGAASAGVGAMGSINEAIDSVSATASKHVAQLHKMQGSLSLLSTVFPFAAEQIARFRGPLDVVTAKAESVADRIDEMNASVGTAASELRGKAYVMTGAWTGLAGSADTFGRSQYYALLPTRLLFREFEGGQRIIKVATHAYNLLTSPIHRVSLALSQGRAEWQDLRARLPALTGGLQLGTRANRLFAQSAYVVGTSVRTVTTAMTPLIKLTSFVGRGFMSLVGSSRSAAGSIARLTGVQNTFVGRAMGMRKAADDVAGSLGKIDAASNKASGSVGAFGSKAGMMKTVAAGLIGGILALGTQTAIATEKNVAVFGSMMHDVGQGAAVVKSLQGTQAAKFFDNQELLDGGRLLYKAGVSAKDLATKTDQLAKIATATSTEFSDLTRIYQQGANAGSFGMDKINQLAERGIDIYGGLTAATGKSGEELRKMISSGQIGITEMDAALAHLTEGNGIYAGSLDAMAGTTAGKFASMKNNITQALGDVMGVALQVFAPFGTALVLMSENVRTTFESFRGPILYASTAAAWFFANFVDLGKFAFATFSLMSVTAFNDFIYFFTTTIPAYLTWFGDNWKQVFMDAGNLIVTVFKNIGLNIGNAMRAIWNFISSGGTAELQFAFVPLLDGFKATVSELPNVPERAMTQLEQNLTAQTEALGGQLANSFDDMLSEAQAQVEQQVPEIKDATDKKAGVTDSQNAAASGGGKPAENKAALVRSEEGQSIFAQMQKALGKGDKEKKAQDAQISMAKDMRDVRREIVRNQKPLVARQF